jgi:hypothetical protein
MSAMVNFFTMILLPIFAVPRLQVTCILNHTGGFVLQQLPYPFFLLNYIEDENFQGDKALINT